jgi:16S rRNA (guanine966-N2)-methyltransferase
MRIIGGKWRGRKVSFAHHDDIRPTPNRVRETLFNWLQGWISDANCLELYAGSGILSIEALSRGAKSVTLVEQSAQVHQHLKVTLSALSGDSRAYHCYNSSAELWASNPVGGPFDIIFLDPPFDSPELGKILPLLIEKELLGVDSLIYIESPQKVTSDDIPTELEIFKQKKAGSVHYCLCQMKPGAIT